MFWRFKTDLIALTTHPGCQETPSAADHGIRLETAKEEILKPGADKLKQEEADAKSTEGLLAIEAALSDSWAGLMQKMTLAATVMNIF